MDVQAVPAVRLHPCNDKPIHADGSFVLYWMTAFRRTGWNFALQHAVNRAVELRRPLLVLESLRSGYAWANDRLHRFVLDGMRAHAEAFERAGVTYHPYVEPAPGRGRGLVAALAEDACLVVTDDFPCFFLPRMVEAAAMAVSVRLEQVDANGLVPVRATTRVFPSAYLFRRFLQSTLRDHLADIPQEEPLKAAAGLPRAVVPQAVRSAWPAVSGRLLEGDVSALADLPIDHDVPAVDLPGGEPAARAALTRFVRDRLDRYADDRNQPEIDGTSRLSPYLHFGNLSAHEAFAAVMTHERWTMRKLGSQAKGAREGWWGVGPSAEGFLDQLCVWREVGFNMCAHRPDYDQYESLPSWAQETLRRHARDRRPERYSLEQLEAGQTADPLWNAAQGQLLEEGWMHNYLRMLWGKKILEWSPTPREALARMIHIMNKHSLDGRDPNSYTGYFWTLGRYDRPWAPERPIFGTIRYMSSANTARKLRVKNYITRYAPAARG